MTGSAIEFRALQAAEGGHRQQEKQWRAQLNTVKTDNANLGSRLKSKEAALVQATSDLDQLHQEAGRLRAQQEERQVEVDTLQAGMEAAQRERDIVLAEARKLRTEGGLTERRMSSEDPPQGDGALVFKCIWVDVMMCSQSANKQGCISLSTCTKLNF